MNGTKKIMSNDADSVLTKILDLVKRKSLLVPNESDKVIDFVHPEELGSKLGGLNIDKCPASEEELDELCDKVVQYSVKTNHPMFLNQLYHGADVHGVAGSWLSDALNTNNHTFEVAPVFIVVEKALLRYIMTDLIGWGAEEGDGIFSPGGSLSNMYGMVLARYQKFPEFKTQGLYAAKAPLVAFTSDESHYSVLKGANWLGLGTENVVKVKTDPRGAMIPEELDAAVRKSRDEGKIPFFVNATSGTTVMGGYDDLDALSSVCKKNGGLWLHVDACWGGSVLLCPKRKGLLMKGVEKVDSLAWNPHKMMGAPLQSSPFVTRHNGLLHRCNSASATYLFQQDKFYDVTYDTGDKSVQCGRKVDAFKVWYLLKARGEDYFDARIEQTFQMADHISDLIKNSPDKFRLMVPEFMCTNVVFIYIPERFRGKPENEEWWNEISKIPPKIKEAVIKKGSLMIGYQPLPHKGIGNCFRLVLHSHPVPTKKDMEFILDEIHRVGNNL